MRDGFFTKTFLDDLPSNATATVRRLCHEFWRLDNELLREENRVVAEHEYVEAYQVFASAFELRGLKIEDADEVGREVEKTVEVVRRKIFSIGETIGSLNLDAEKTAVTKCDPTDPECQKLATMMEEMTELIKGSKALAEPSKLRLRRRLLSMRHDLLNDCCSGSC